MFDLVKLTLIAGDGGNGKVSFHRAKFITKGGPDGGQGGDAGSIYVRGSRHLNSLQHYAGVKRFEAQNGQHGGKQKQIGHKGEDLFLEVPVGTIIWILAENKSSLHHRLHYAREGNMAPADRLTRYYLDKPSGNPPPRPEDEVRLVEAAAQTENTEEEEFILRSPSLQNVDLKKVKKVLFTEITEHGQEVMICRGGIGGRGNDSFKGSSNTTPFEAEYGSFGEKKIVLFELRLLADIGLVGYPNAGKSTLLSIVTKANPKIANYPFTTLEPNLGVMSVGDREVKDVILADIPGIIEGASEGKGLGFDFLRHISSCKALLYILSLDESVIFNQSIPDAEKVSLLLEQLQILKQELHSYDAGLAKKKSLISISKSDLYSNELKQELRKAFEKQGTAVTFFSAVTKEGLKELQEQLTQATY